MKKIINLTFYIAVLLPLLFAACKKNDVTIPAPSADPVAFSADDEKDTVPTIKAGPDTTIQLPYNKALLKVTGNNFYNPLIKWEKISGPNSFKIANVNSGNTVVYNLEAGVYQFEVNVTNYMQPTLKDTITVTILPDKNVYTTEKLFENIVWAEGVSCSSFTINNISSIIPAKHPFKVYLKADANTDWQLVFPDGQVPNELDFYYYYHFFINNNRLVVYVGNDPFGGGGGDYASTNTIKIVY